MDRPVNFAYLEARAVEVAVQLAERGCVPRVIAMSLARSGVPPESARLLADALARVRRPDASHDPTAQAKSTRSASRSVAHVPGADREARAAAAALGWMVQTLAIGGIAAAILWLAGTGLGYEAGFASGAIDGFEHALLAIERTILLRR